MSLVPHRVDYSPIIDRPRVTWPNNARVAFWVAPNVEHYGTLVKYSFRRLYRDGAQNGRLLVLHLHPWLIGQPFRIRYLDDALKFITRHQGAWVTNGATIIDWFRQHPVAEGRSDGRLV